MIGTVSRCDWRALAERVRDTVGQVDALIVDAPYSARTHSGHDAVPEAERRATLRAHPDSHGGGGNRRPIPYASWSHETVSEFVSMFSTLTRGWMVSITDNVLAPTWAAAMEESGRYVFAPLPYVHVGGRVRLSGDGPSSWTCWLVVSRPRSVEFSRWGTLPGAYILNGGHERLDLPGGKPLSVMESLVRDYTRPGDIVCDPCCGAGTTLLAAKMLGRQYIGGDIDAAHVAIAEERLRDLPTAARKGTLALPWNT